MTGAAEGKLELGGADIRIVEEEERRKIRGEVYIHLKGYARARVTHLDIESDDLSSLLRELGRGKFLSIHGIEGGISPIFSSNLKLEVYHPLLNEVLKLGERTRTWVGGKFGGIYIGFRKPQVRKLEEIAIKKFKTGPK